MARRLLVLAVLAALWPGPAPAQSAAVMDAYDRYKALEGEGRIAECEPLLRRARARMVVGAA